jgi:hypothetical protein
MCVDLNSIKSEDELKGDALSCREEKTTSFNNFIEDAKFVDLPLVGHRLTWSRLDGSSMRRLDRFLLLELLLASWFDFSRLTFDRCLSDHCLIALNGDDVNWGPKPIAILKC